MDAVSEAGRIGISADRSATFLNDSEGIATNYRVAACAIGRMMRNEALDEGLLDEVRADYKARCGKQTSSSGTDSPRKMKKNGNV